MAQKLNVNTSVTDYYKSTGRDSSFAARKKAAETYGIDNYTGTAEQNTLLLQRTKAADAKTTTPSTTKTTTAPIATASRESTKNTQASTNSGAIASKVKTGVTTGVNSTATAVIDNLNQLVAAAIPEGGDYSYKEFKKMAVDNPQLKSAQELAKLYGLDYNLENIYDTLMKSVDRGYDARYTMQDQADSKYYDNAATAQSTLSDTLRKQQSQAILAGTNKGMQAAQALSAMLGTSQQFAANATQLAMDRELIAKEYAAAQAQTGASALDKYNLMGQQLADVSKNVYSSDTSKYVGQLDYNSSVNTANAQLQAQSISAKAQWESTYASSIASAYQAYYNGQITLEQARIQADAAIKSAKAYGLDSAKVTADANKEIAATNAASNNYMADKNYAGTIYAAGQNYNAATDAAKISADGYNAQNAANTKTASANLVTGLIAGYNTNPASANDVLATLEGYYAAGLIDQGTYNSTKNLIKVPGITPTPSVPVVPTPPVKPTTTPQGTTIYDNGPLSPNAGGGYKY